MDPEDNAPGRCSTVLYYTWKICTCLFSHVVLVSLVVAYCILGAVTFHSLEYDNEIKVKRNISRMRSNVTEELWKIFQESPVLHQENWTITVRGHLKLFEQDLLRAMKSDGWDGSEDEKVVQWTFAGALFYSIIVITTIGYGHIAPKTQWGKVVTIFYAILGIPLMLLCLSNIGDVMAQSFRFLYWRVCCFICTRRPKRRRGRSRRQGTHGSARSRTASFRRSGRASQRSADSALGLSECRSSYSDSDCRYFDEGERDVNRASTHSRHSDTAITSSSTTPVDLTGTDPAVLFNRYALDREEKARREVSPPPHNKLCLERRRLPHYNNRPRIMSPMGFAISRQHSQRAPRLGRLREDPSDYDDLTDFDYDYEESTASGSGQPSRTRPVPIWLCVFLVATYILCGALLFMKWEGWEFLDAAYFCFITLTTIGFGDFVPARRVQESESAEISIALCSLYLLFGIALLAMSFNLVQEEVINNVKSVAKRLGIVKDDEEDED